MASNSVLEIIDYKSSDGAPAEVGQEVVVHYSVALSLESLEKSEWIDWTYKKGPTRFVLGEGQALKGIDLGLQGMRVGSTRRLVIPADLAFGKRGVPNKVPPDVALVFEVYLIAAE